VPGRGRKLLLILKKPRSYERDASHPPKGVVLPLGEKKKLTLSGGRNKENRGKEEKSFTASLPRERSVFFRVGQKEAAGNKEKSFSSFSWGDQGE